MSRQPPPSKVLIVEDDPIANEAFAQILRHQGWNVYQAHTVAEAIHFLRSKPDYVLLDLLLPDGDGDDVMHAIRDVEHLDSKVIVMTGRENGEGSGKLWSQNIIGYLTKPVDMVQLFYLLQHESS